MPSTLIDNVYIYNDIDKNKEQMLLIEFDEEDGILNPKVRLTKKIYNICLELLKVSLIVLCFFGIIGIITYIILKKN